MKRYIWGEGKRVGLEVTRRLAQGTEAQLAALIEQTQGWGVLNTAFIERLNATFRARLACLGRRTRNLTRKQESLHSSMYLESLHSSMYLVGTVYNFCTYHTSLLSEAGLRRTPAMAAGITVLTIVGPCGNCCGTEYQTKLLLPLFALPPHTHNSHPHLTPTPHTHNSHPFPSPKHTSGG